jgi:hypothetical protein
VENENDREGALCLLRSLEDGAQAIRRQPKHLEVHVLGLTSKQTITNPRADDQRTAALGAEG